MKNKTQAFSAESKGLFCVIEGIKAVITVNGVYKQVDVFERNNQMYAAVSRSGYVSMYKGHRTSKDKVSWRQIVSTTNKGFSYSFGAMDWMEVTK